MNQTTLPFFPHDNSQQVIKFNDNHDDNTGLIFNQLNINLMMSQINNSETFDLAEFKTFMNTPKKSNTLQQTNNDQTVETHIVFKQQGVLSISHTKLPIFVANIALADENKMGLLYECVNELSKNHILIPAYKNTTNQLSNDLENLFITNLFNQQEANLQEETVLLITLRMMLAQTLLIGFSPMFYTDEDINLTHQKLIFSLCMDKKQINPSLHQDMSNYIEISIPYQYGMALDQCKENQTMKSLLNDLLLLNDCQSWKSWAYQYVSLTLKWCSQHNVGTALHGVIKQWLKVVNSPNNTLDNNIII